MLVMALILYGLDMFYVNLLIFCTSFMSHVHAKVELLKQKLINKKLSDDEVKAEIKRIVLAHNAGIELANQLEDISNFLMLVLYSVSTLVLCFLFFEFNIVS